MVDTITHTTYCCKHCKVEYPDLPVAEQCESSPVPEPKVSIGTETFDGAGQPYKVEQAVVYSYGAKSRKHGIKYQVSNAKGVGRLLLERVVLRDLWVEKHTHEETLEVEHLESHQLKIFIYFKRVPYAFSRQDKTPSYGTKITIGPNDQPKLREYAGHLIWSSVSNDLANILANMLKRLPNFPLEEAWVRAKELVEAIHKKLQSLDQSEIQAGRPSIFH